MNVKEFQRCEAMLADMHDHCKKQTCALHGCRSCETPFYMFRKITDFYEDWRKLPVEDKAALDVLPQKFIARHHLREPATTAA